MRKPTLTEDAIYAALSIAMLAGCARAERAAPDPAPAAAPQALPSPAPSPASSGEGAGGGGAGAVPPAAAARGAAAGPGADPNKAALGAPAPKAIQAVDAGDEVKRVRPPGAAGTASAHASCAAGACSPEMKKGNH